MASDTYILVGLGNPGAKYTNTRHNIGFVVIDAIAEKAGAPIFKEKWEAETAKVSLWGATVHLVKPMTYMNLSGRSVARFVDFYKIPLANLLIIHDDLDMKTGRLKLVHSGGAGGHKGILSIANTIGETNFYRLKIGIGRPGRDGVPGEMPVERFVLTSFKEEESRHINDRMAQVIGGIQTYVAGDPSRSMNYINSFK